MACFRNRRGLFLVLIFFLMEGTGGKTADTHKTQSGENVYVRPLDSYVQWLG